MASLNIKELCEVLNCSRPTIMKALNGNKTVFRPYMRKKGKAIHVTKSGLKLLAEILKKDISAFQSVEVQEPVIVEEQLVETVPLEPNYEDPIINSLIVAVNFLREELQSLKDAQEKERRTRQKLSREIKMKERVKTKAMRELFGDVFAS